MDTKTISEDDLQILREAISQQSQASSNRAFVESFLSRKYGLQNGDGVDAISGVINRTSTEIPSSNGGGE